MRLWLPQLFASIREYEQLVESNQTESTSTSICVIIDYSVNRTKSQLAQALDNSDMECTVNVSPASYTNNLIVAAAGLFSYMLAGFLVNLVGFKRIMCKCDRHRNLGEGKLCLLFSCISLQAWASSPPALVPLACTGPAHRPRLWHLHPYSPPWAASRPHRCLALRSICSPQRCGN